MKPLQLQISSISLSYFIHATEDRVKLNDSVRVSFGLEENEITIEKLEGYYGNVLESVKVHLFGKRAEQVVEIISSGLGELARKQLLTLLDASMDEHDALYLRLDRQALESGLSLSDREPIRVKVKPKFRAGGRDAMKLAFMERLRL